jgi:hypothetical protein
MNKREESERLAKTKLALAEKYERRAADAGSKPKKQQFRHKAEKYRRQATEVLRS